ncbi:FAD-binding domain-containing protein [Variovorax sp. PCZ-1]|uniref:cryptochrome/deoxyribodipyrimidine photo-lyase family protein n=1 Tax=Variovorax sp. PCZ-1 TaxID=2835533 RepID=UPI001BCF6952|nr:deoxyribodipyrimidine photo-lyase/cryptochrome family protein [Variovorax sp. PCZ-1]
MLQVVWFKKDLRLSDHAPLARAVAQARERGAKVLAIWVYEPQMWRQSDMGARHLQFANDCLRELSHQIAEQGGQLLRLQAEMVDVLSRLKEAFGIFELHSHEETGNGWSYARDQAVMRWCRAQGVAWHQQPSNAVVRRLLSHGGGRNKWSAHWTTRMESEPLPTPQGVPWMKLMPTALQNCGEVNAQDLEVTGEVSQHIQRGGRSLAEEELFSFLTERGQYYRSEMSNPLGGAQSCSRISPHLAWGTLSIKEAVYATWARRQQLHAMLVGERPSGYLQSLKSFEGRLHWHCHFIQKLESEPEIEWRNVHRGFTGMRNEGELTEEESLRFNAWATGHTGYPFIDACMRSLIATGWLNFRMRAMMMSFASYQLWLHWRHSGLHLARLFTDYEPGIHWSQCQMQSGVTGINTVRIYNPVKQSQDQDPAGHFIRRWVPELRGVEAAFIHEPWACFNPPPDYPAPIVELQSATREAKEKIYDWKNRPGIRETAAKVYDKHGSRNPAREGVQRRRKASVTSAAIAAVESEQQTSFDF